MKYKSKTTEIECHYETKRGKCSLDHFKKCIGAKSCKSFRAEGLWYDGLITGC
jgi:hypothetical protein